MALDRLLLEPSRAMAPSFESVAAVLRDGRVLVGVKVAESEAALTLGDSQGEVHEVLKAEVLNLEPQPQSLMPEGLEKQLTEAEFVDLIAFLVAAKDR